MKVLDKFKQVGKNIFSVFEKNQYNDFDFQNLLLKTNKSVRKIVFKYDSKNSKYESFLDTNNIQVNGNLYVNIIFTNTKGSVTYEFKNKTQQELLTVYTNGQHHDFLMEGVKILDKHQIQEVYNILDLSKTLVKIQKICEVARSDKEKSTSQKPELTPHYINNTVFCDINNQEFISNKINNLKKNLHVSLRNKLKM